MPQTDEMLLIYLELALASQSRHQFLVRDKMLILASASAVEMGWEEIAESCRREVLKHNPRHLVRRWPRMELAVGAERFQAYFKQLRRKYSPEKAEYMVQSLGIARRAPLDVVRGARQAAAVLLDEIEQTSTVKSRRDAAARQVSGMGKLLDRRKAKGRRHRSRSPKDDRLTLGGSDDWMPFYLGLAVLLILAVLWACGLVK